MRLITSRGWKELIEIYRWSLKQRFGMMILYSVLLFIAFPMVLFITIANKNSQVLMGYTQINVENEFLNTYKVLFPALVIPLSLIFMLILTVMLFNYMHQKRSTDYFHSVPVGRVPMLLGKYFAGLTMLFVPLILNFGIVAIADAANHFGAILTVVSILHDMLWVMFMITAAYSFTVLMAVCSGTTMDMVVSSIIINIAYPILIALCQHIILLILPGVNSGVNLRSISIILFSPYFAAVFPTLKYNNMQMDATFIIWWCLFILIVFAASIILYRKRKSESAENNFAFPLPKAIIRFVVTAAAGLGLGMLLSTRTECNQFNFFFGVFAGSLLSHIILEAVYSRGFKELKKSLKYYGAFAVLFIAAYAILSFGFFGYDSRIPAAGDISNIEVSTPARNFFYDNTNMQVLDGKGDQLALIGPRISSTENIEKIRKLHQDIIDFFRQKSYPYSMNTNGCQIFRIIYHLKSGGTLTRTYLARADGSFNNSNLSKSNMDNFCLGIENLKEYKAGTIINYLEPSYVDKVNITNGTSSYILKSGDDSKLEFINALKQDIQETDAASMSNQPELTIQFSLKDGFTPTENSPLKKLIGNYDGKVHFHMSNNGSYTDFDKRITFNIPKDSPHLSALIKKYNWFK